MTTTNTTTKNAIKEEARVKMYQIFEEICVEHMIETCENENWTLVQMVEECEYWYSCYFETGHCRCEEMKAENLSKWRSETGKLRAFIKKYKAVAEGVDKAVAEAVETTEAVSEPAEETETEETPAPAEEPAPAPKKAKKAVIAENGKTEVIEGIKASYDPETKSYVVKATMKVSAKWYKAKKNRKGEVTSAERVEFYGNNKFYCLVATRMGNKIKFDSKCLAKLENKTEADTMSADSKMYKTGFEELKKYLIKKWNLKDMNYETMLRKLGAIADVEEC